MATTAPGVFRLQWTWFVRLVGTRFEVKARARTKEAGEMTTVAIVDVRIYIPDRGWQHVVQRLPYTNFDRHVKAGGQEKFLREMMELAVFIHDGE